MAECYQLSFFGIGITKAVTSDPAGPARVQAGSNTLEKSAAVAHLCPDVRLRIFNNHTPGLK